MLVADWVTDMQFDDAKIDDAVLALLYLTLHDNGRAWKSLDFDAMNRLHRRGLILDPASKAKSVVLTEEGEAKAKALAERLFGKIRFPEADKA